MQVLSFQWQLMPVHHRFFLNSFRLETEENIGRESLLFVIGYVSGYDGVPHGKDGRADYLKLVVEHILYNRGETIEANLLLRMMSKVIGYFQLGYSYYGI